MEIANLIKEYLQVVISRPAITLGLGMYFFVSFKEDLRQFLKNTRSMKLGSVEFSQEKQMGDSSNEAFIDGNQNQDVEEIESFKSELEELKKKGEGDDKFIKFLFDEMNSFEVKFLNLFLVFNSKISLLWFYNMGKSTQENYIINFTGPDINIDISEKQTIFNVLVTHGLLLFKDGVYEVSWKGQNFLREINFIK